MSPGNDHAPDQSTSNGDTMPTIPFDPNDPLRQIIRVDQMGGLNADLDIVDPNALAESLQEAGLDQAQITALRRSDLSLDTYISLIQLERACLQAQGIEPSEVQISTLQYGLQQPTYGYPSEVTGLTPDDVSLIQVTCQNQFTGAYQTLYAAHLAPSAEEAMTRDLKAANEFLACARQLGLEPPLDVVANAAEFETFYAWYSTPEADVECPFNP